MYSVLLLLSVVLQCRAIVLVEADRLSRLAEPQNRKEPRRSGLCGAGNEADLRLLLRANMILSLAFPKTNSPHQFYNCLFTVKGHT